MRKTCLNCDEEGHKFKNCKLPIQSYGIIAYQKKPFEQANFILIQRRNTIAYTDFLRGKYKRANISQYVNQMTKDEKINLLTCNFEKLWNDLWFDHNSNIYKNELYKAKDAFNKLNIHEIISDINSSYPETEWGIPKGRRSLNETPIACATREFSEETELNPKSYDIHYDIPPLIEEFTAIDGNTYKHVYYLAKLNNNTNIDKTKKTKIYFQEVKDIGLFKLDKCLELIRDYSVEKKQVLIKAQSILKDIKSTSIKWN